MQKYKSPEKLVNLSPGLCVRLAAVCSDKKHSADFIFIEERGAFD